MTDSRSPRGIPIWVRLPGTIVLVLVGVVVSAILAGAAGLGGEGATRHAPNQRTDQPVQQQDRHRPGSGGQHGPTMGDHGG